MLIDNWKTVATGAWSSHAFIALILLNSVSVSLTAMMDDPLLNATWVQIASIVVAALGQVLRLLIQPNLSPTNPDEVAS